jgi:hypothetical protein
MGRPPNTAHYAVLFFAFSENVLPPVKFQHHDGPGIWLRGDFRAASGFKYFGNAATGREATWQPIDNTPTHPKYSCAHCIVWIEAFGPKPFEPLD